LEFTQIILCYVQLKIILTSIVKDWKLKESTTIQVSDSVHALQDNEDKTTLTVLLAPKATVRDAISQDSALDVFRMVLSLLWSQVVALQQLVVQVALKFTRMPGEELVLTPLKYWVVQNMITWVSANFAVLIQPIIRMEFAAIWKIRSLEIKILSQELVEVVPRVVEFVKMLRVAIFVNRIGL
jgi:hypothetical protein